MEDLQFVLFVTALCTSELPTLNIPEVLRREIFDRCWALVHEGPPPAAQQERVLDLRSGTEVTLDALVETIRTMLTEAGITTLVWDHPASEPRLPSSPGAQPLIDRLKEWEPPPPGTKPSNS
jgi:hypothetical protein